MDIKTLEASFRKKVGEYEDLMEASLVEVEVDNKSLKDALKEQNGIQFKWERMSKSMDYYFNVCETISESMYADAIDRVMNNNYRDIKHNEARDRAKKDNDYRAARMLMNEIRHYRDEARGVLDVVISRRYILNNLTEAMCRSVDKDLI